MSVSAQELAECQGALGDLFALLWTKVEPHISVLRSKGWLGGEALEARAIEDLIRRSPTVPASVQDYLLGRAASFPVTVPADSVVERMYVVMCAIDSLAGAIHPRVAKQAGLVSDHRIPPLLRQMRTLRRIEGSYGFHKLVGKVVPKGPLRLGGHDREEDDFSGDILEPHFNFLTILRPLTGPHTVTIEQLTPSEVEGVFHWNAPRVAIIPAAEDAEDLVFTDLQRGRGYYLDVRPNPEIVTKDKVSQAVIQALTEGAQLVVLPELGVTPEIVESISEQLRCQNPPFKGFRMVVCGSFVSRETCPKQEFPYNEAVILSGSGTELWRQRKMHHFNMQADRIRSCHIEVTHPDHAHIEAVATCSHLKVYDIDTAGRFMVLICEDLEQQKPGGDTALTLLPDWIISPVLDVSQNIGRWPHQRSIEIGRHSASRFVIANSACLPVRTANLTTLAETKDIAVGICIDGAEQCKFKQAFAEQAVGKPTIAQIDWLPETWQRYKLIARTT